MNTHNRKIQKQPNRDEVLTKAIINLVASYGLQGKELSEIIGISEASISRLHQGSKLISEHSKEGELSLLLIRMFRSLNALVGNDVEKAKLWLNSYNEYFLATPRTHIQHISGLVEVVNYLDAFRGKL